MGATHTINANNLDPEKEILKILGGKRADVVIDNTGDVEIIKKAYNVTNNEGKTVLVGVPPAEKEVSFHTLPLHFNKQIVGSHGGESEPDVDISNYINLYNNGKLKIDNLITKHYSLNEINTAINDIKNGVSAGRCMITMNHKTK